MRAVEPVTVVDACEAYLNEEPGSIAEGVFRRHHLQSWRKRLEQAPTLLTRNKKGDTRIEDRAEPTVNRDMLPLSAALGRVLGRPQPVNDQERLAAFLTETTRKYQSGVYA